MNRLPPVPVLSSVELPQNFKIGLSQKKQHEIMHLANLIGIQCKRHDIRTIIDLGAGLVREYDNRKKITNVVSCYSTIFFLGICMPNVTLFARLSSLRIGKKQRKY